MCTDRQRTGGWNGPLETLNMGGAPMYFWIRWAVFAHDVMHSNLSPIILQVIPGII
jgi:hypothetical protein